MRSKSVAFRRVSYARKKAAKAASPATAPKELEMELAAPVKLAIGGNVELDTNISQSGRRGGDLNIRDIHWRNDSSASTDRTVGAGHESGH